MGSICPSSRPVLNLASHSTPAPPLTFAVRRGQLQCSAQQFSQTAAKLTDSICKSRRPVLKSFHPCAAADLRGALGELAQRSRSFNAALSSSARLLQRETQQEAESCSASQPADIIRS